MPSLIQDLSMKKKSSNPARLGDYDDGEGGDSPLWTTEDGGDDRGVDVMPFEDGGGSDHEDIMSEHRQHAAVMSRRLVPPHLKRSWHVPKTERNNNRIKACSRSPSPAPHPPRELTPPPPIFPVPANLLFSDRAQSLVPPPPIVIAPEPRCASPQDAAIDLSKKTGQKEEKKKIKEEKEEGEEEKPPAPMIPPHPAFWNAWHPYLAYGHMLAGSPLLHSPLHHPPKPELGAGGEESDSSSGSAPAPGAGPREPHHHDGASVPVLESVKNWAPGYKSAGKTRTNERWRITYTAQQTKALEMEFLGSRFIHRSRRHQLARAIGLTDRQIKIWFQNRRQKAKKEEKRRQTGGPEGDSKDKEDTTLLEDIKYAMS